MNQYTTEPPSGGVITFGTSLQGEIYFQFPKWKTCIRPNTHTIRAVDSEHKNLFGLLFWLLGDSAGGVCLSWSGNIKIIEEGGSLKSKQIFSLWKISPKKFFLSRVAVWPNG